MNTLHELQSRFIATVFDSGNTALRDIDNSPLPAKQLLRIYHNNIFITMTEALQTHFAVCHKLVGDEYFAMLARQYAKQHTPAFASLHRFGEHFSDFLRQHPIALQLPYLADVAVLEWAVQECYHSRDNQPFDFAGLARIDSQKYPGLIFLLNPSARLLVSDYPVLTIWQFHQDGYGGNDTIDIDNSSEHILVQRHGLQIEFIRVNPPAFAFLRAMAQGLPFAHVCEAAVNIDDAFQADAFFQQCVLNNTVTAFKEPAEV